MNKKFTFSHSVVSYRINDDYYFIYHSLYGNGRIVSTDFFNELKLIKSYTLGEIKNILGNDVSEQCINFKFIIEDGVSERKFLKEELKKREKLLSSGCFFDRLHLSTTNKCNMNCKYCFCNTFEYEKEGNRENLRFPNTQMSFDIAKKSIEKSIKILKANNKSSLSVEFFGGEPFLNPELIKQVVEYFENGEKYGIEIEYGCTTNGTIIPDDILPYLVKYKVRIAISIDYINKETGKFRSSGQLKYKWNCLDENIRKLVKNKVHVRFQSVLSEETWDKFSYEIIDYASSLNIQNIGLILSFDFSFFSKFQPEQIGEKVLQAYEYCKEKNILLSGYWYQSFFGIINPNLWEEKRAWKTCPTIGRLVSVEPNGDVYACKTTSKKLGNIENFNGIFKGDHYKYYAMRAYSNSENCVNCEIEGFCSGSCSGALENKFGNIYSCDEGYCRTIKYIVNGLIKKYTKEVAATLIESI